MRLTKFYKDDGRGGLDVAVLKTADPGLDRMARKPYPTTLALAEKVMARLGFRRKNSLPTALRKRIPAGGLAPNFDLSKSLVAP